MTKKIKPGFITYRSSRFSKVSQYSVKYGQTSHQIEYGHQNQVLRRQEYLTQALGKKRIRHVLYVVLTTDFKLERFVKFCKKLRFITNVSLHLGEEITEDPKPSYLIRLFRKLFVQNKHMTNLTLDFVNEGNLSKIINRTLKFTKNIENIKFTYELFPETLLKPILEDLSHQLRILYHRNNWRSLTSQSFSFHILQNIFNEILFSECLFNFYTKMQDKPISIDLLFYFLFTNPQVVQGVAKTIKNIPALKSLSLGSWMAIDLTTILEAIKQNKCISTFDIYIPNQEVSSYNLLPSLPGILQNIPSLKKLEVSFDNVQQIAEMNKFLSELVHIQQIENLHLVFSAKNNINDKTLQSLAGSLEHLENLKILTVSCNMQSLSSALTSKGIQSFFEVISRLDKLKELCISFNGYKQVISDSIVKVLFKSIGHLKNLEHLLINLESNAISSKSIPELTKSFKNLQRIESLRLNFGSSEWLSGKVVTSLIQRIGEFRNMSDLHLHLKCKEVDSEGVIGSLGKMAYSLRSLNSLHLILCRNNDVSGEDLKSLDEIMARLEKRIQVDYVNTLSKD